MPMKLDNEKLLRTCADTGNLAEIKRLLSQGVDANAADSFGFTALEYALNSYPHLPDKDHLGIVKTLVEGGADVKVKAQNGQTPLFTAAAEGLYEVVVYLHQEGVDINARLDTGANALHTTPDGIINRPLNFQVTLQQDGKTVTLTDPDEIRQATGSHPDDEFEARLKTVEYLLENGMDVNAQLHESGQTVLFRAADLGTEEIVALILERETVEIDHTDTWGLTALHYACRQGHLGVAERLIESGATVNVQEAYGFTPLHEAAENGHFEIVKMLIERGADSRIGLKKKYQSYLAGFTALDVAREAGREEIVDYLSKV
jgi:ankyrin repeat protein